MKIRALLLTTALAFTVPAIAQEAAAPSNAQVQPMNVTDPTEFATMAAPSNMFEIESSKLALERATSEDVKTFAQQMIDDHSKAGEAMKAAASQDGVTPPSELDQKHQEMLDQVSRAEGDAFDAAYVAAQVQAHDEAVALFEGFANTGENSALKQFAETTLPTLQQHREHIRTLAANY
ncbi:DUF4142 domain-containing protein [Devosia sp. PTR5]|uniref:DUF4142 domain-containing protein n=1 Tax=Devosia oryzisoli TaxID=2774138 RepID=A0A927IRH6_9HYPH|nr:DUF4142 domain-containing protein [Devosia oryzisoli]MBD8064429.1 DUF4142 domain-containing protein [Devosia oryzisoli]